MDALLAEANAAAETAVPVARPRPAVVPGRILHLDGDGICYLCGGNESTTVAESRQRALDRIASLRDWSGSEGVVFHYTEAASHKGYRFIVSTVRPYQGQRKSGRRPQNWQYLRDWSAGYNGPAFRPKGWGTREADDGVAHVAWEAAKTGQLIAICSQDKDFRMLPGVHINMNTYDLTTVRPGDYSVVGADGLQYGTKWFWLQMLQGDSADNIPGLERYVKPNGKDDKCGEVTAGKLLADCTNDAEAYATVMGHYTAYYGNECAPARFAEQAMLLWLRRDAKANIENFLDIVPTFAHARFAEPIEVMYRRIKEAYAEAQSLRAA